jgi:hypothetical protein
VPPQPVNAVTPSAAAKNAAVILLFFIKPSIPLLFSFKTAETFLIVLLY